MFDIYVRHQARVRPSAPAFVWPSGALTFAKFDADVSRAAGLLRLLDAGPDRPVAVAVDDFYLNWVFILALARLGIPSSPGADRECPLRISQRSERNAAFVIGEREIAAIVSGPMPDLQRPDIAQAALGRIMLSSGTTGDEKRIALSWQMIEASIRNVPMAYGAPPGPWLMGTGSHTILGFVLTLGCWALGNAVLMVPDPMRDGEQALALGPGLIGTTPGQLAHFLDHLSGVRPDRPVRVVTGGGPLPPKLLARTKAVLTQDVLSVYGASECGAVTIASSSVIERSPSAAGFVLPGVTVQIVDDQGSILAPGELGHVRVRSDRVANGYLRGESSAFRNGWFYPGDLGRLDAHGLLCLEGRADDLMNLGGQKVLPAWVEAAAEAAPGVIETAAFAVRDEDGWERCCIAVVANEAFDASAFGEAMAGPLKAAEKITWRLVDRLPRNAMGKIDRNALRKSAQTAWRDK